MKKVLLIVLVSCLGGALTAQNVSFTNTNVSTNYQDIGVVDMNGDHLDDLLSVSRTNIQIFISKQMVVLSKEILPRRKQRIHHLGV